MMVTTPSDRVQLIDRGSLMHPGCCALCGSGNCDEGYVDTGIYYDYEGQVYFCWNCALQIASVIGCLSADEHEHLKTLLANTVNELNAVKEQARADAERLNDYDTLMLRAISNGLDSDVADNLQPTEASASAVTSADESVSGPSVGSDEGKPVAKKSVASSGRRKPPRTQRSDSDAEGLEF